MKPTEQPYNKNSNGESGAVFLSGKLEIVELTPDELSGVSRLS